MAALVPPPNTAGINLPPVPQNPPVFSDIAQAMDYVNELVISRRARLNPTLATDQDVGRAEAYKAGVTFAAADPLAAPAWLQAFQDNMNQQFAIVNQNFANVNQRLNDIVAGLNLMRGEQPILLANSTAGTEGRLYNPNFPGAWVPLLQPSSRDELMGYSENQCIVASNALGLEQLGPQTDLDVRRRQIAMKIGVKI